MTIILVVLQIEFASSHLKSLKVHEFMCISLTRFAAENRASIDENMFLKELEVGNCNLSSKSGKKMPRGMFANFLRLSSEF